MTERKTLQIRERGDDDAAPTLNRKGRGWAISETRLDTLHDRARELRRHPTEAQTALWDRFVKADLGKYRFRRQVVIGSAIVDFACQPLGLAIQVESEADGASAIAHRRDKSLAEVGIHLMRFSEEAIAEDIDAVLAEILAAMKERWRARRTKPRSTIARSRPDHRTRPNDRGPYRTGATDRR
ncbi:endonuclease domain-containing protein [Croceicoccus sp. YJ47]|uniref:endonuclease domain-containing protein n=1 Tax=Croceicoccus sp. YJ47 TaxID=2798724 RepID=UPI0019243724|nr:DUF559 domain-containing protein [Croceicoccus sp. YJ47]QQN74678.1 DUF559 domain-containing protein [Croceicoccus sp. YJ47]